MPRSRRKSSSTSHNVSAAWARRNARARALGYRNEYERRTRSAPGAERPPADELRRLRGHVGPADLEHEARGGDFVTAQLAGRDSEGRYREILVTIDREGSTRQYRIRGKDLSKDRLQALVQALTDVDVDFAQAPSQDLKAIAAKASEG